MGDLVTGEELGRSEVASQFQVKGAVAASYCGRGWFLDVAVPARRGARYGQRGKPVVRAADAARSAAPATRAPPAVHIQPFHARSGERPDRGSSVLRPRPRALG